MGLHRKSDGAARKKKYADQFPKTEANRLRKRARHLKKMQKKNPS